MAQAPSLVAMCYGGPETPTDAKGFGFLPGHTPTPPGSLLPWGACGPGVPLPGVLPRARAGAWLTAPPTAPLRPARHLPLPWVPYPSHSCLTPRLA